MNTRLRRPLQAAALLFSLSLFIGYLWSAQRRSGLPSIEAFPAAEVRPPQPVDSFAETSTITLDLATILDFEDFLHYGEPVPTRIPAAPFMPGSKSISQPIFSTRKETPADQATAPVMPGSKIGIISLPMHAPIMSGTKSGPVDLIPPPKADTPEKTTP